MQYFFDDIEPELLKAINNAIDIFKQLGAKLTTVHLPQSFYEAIDAHYVVLRAEAASYHQKNYNLYPHLYGREIRELFLDVGLKISAIEYIQAQQVRLVYRTELIKMLKQIDVLITPSSSSAAPKGLSSTGSAAFNSPFTNAGVPTLNLPIGFSQKSGLPFGLQLVTTPLNEEKLITLGHAYQKVTNWHKRLQQIKINSIS